MTLAPKAALGLALAIGPLTATALPMYTMQALTLPGYAETYVAGLNDSGQVAAYGANYATNGGIAGFLTGVNGSGTTLVLGPNGESTQPVGVSGSGQVVGYAVTSAPGPSPFITGPNGVGASAIPSGPTGLGAVPQQGILGFETYPNAISGSGRITGSLYSAPAEYAFISGPNGVGLTNIGTLGGFFGVGNAVNDTGQVAGTATTAGPLSQTLAFITGPDGVGMQAIDVPGAVQSQAFGINGLGQVVGTFATAGYAELHAFMTGANGANPIELASLGAGFSDALAINDAGQVVGRYFDPLANGRSRAFVTGANGTGITLLDELLIGNTDGVAIVASPRNVFINNRGQIAVDGLTANGVRAFLLTPVPLPAPYWLLGSAALILLRGSIRGTRYLSA